VAPVLFAFNMIKDGIGLALGAVKSVVESAVGWIKDKFISGFTVVSATVRTVFSGITSTIRSMVQGVINFFIGAINRLIGVINTAIRAYNRIPLAPDISTISPIPQVALAKGGIVTGPTIALVGEAGPEMVVPLTGPYRPDFMDQAPSSGTQQIVIKNTEHARSFQCLSFRYTESQSSIFRKLDHRIRSITKNNIRFRQTFRKIACPLNQILTNNNRSSCERSKTERHLFPKIHEISTEPRQTFVDITESAEGTLGITKNLDSQSTFGSHQNL